MNVSLIHLMKEHSILEVIPTNDHIVFSTIQYKLIQIVTIYAS